MGIRTVGRQLLSQPLRVFTNPQKAAPGTIRADLGLDIGRNLVHGSDSVQAAERELSVFFQEGEIVSYELENQRWITES